MNFCNIPLATTLTCVVCMFKNLMNFKIRMTVTNTVYFTDRVLLRITAYKIPNVWKTAQKLNFIRLTNDQA